MGFVNHLGSMTNLQLPLNSRNLMKDIALDKKSCVM